MVGLKLPTSPEAATGQEPNTNPHLVRFFVGWHFICHRMRIMNTRYKLVRGSQVRQEDFGLLFYRMNGPRLYFISSGDLLTPEFFKGVMTLDEWMIHNSRNNAGEEKIKELEKTLSELSEKKVIIEC
jgi:putative mycofactocin binding protein MftB